jgi:hypothetical protein
MKKFKYILYIAAISLLAGCGEDFLDQKQLYLKTDADFYKTPQDVADALTGAYSVLPSFGGATNPTVMANLLSDDCFGGGGSGDITFHDLDKFTNSQADNYYPFWQEYYKGILRVNKIIDRSNQSKFDNEADKNQAIGEAYFLRSYFHFTLAKFFGNIPLITDPVFAVVPQAKPEVLYAQIASDMKKAIELMKNENVNAIASERAGHATKWAAEGMMARIFLFYTGYYNKTELPLNEGGAITKANVISWLDDCITNSGHDLTPDFRNFWPYSCVNMAKPNSYPYATNNNLTWVGDAGEKESNGQLKNKETVFAIKYSTYGGWTLPTKVTYSNQVCLYMGLRIQEGLVPWSQGWGAGPVNPLLKESFEDGDIREKGSIIDVTDPEEGNASTKYVWGSNQCMHETGLWNKKYTSLQVKQGTSFVGVFTILVPGSNTSNQLWNLQDEILMRFSDILLMGAELGGPNAQTYLDRVRARVGLPSKTASLENIKEERRHELAFEGVRYFDLLRWHDAEAAFTKVTNIPVKNSGVDDMYDASYRPETGGFLPIPETEISLSSDVLKQNPGW